MAPLRVELPFSEPVSESAGRKAGRPELVSVVVPVLDEEDFIEDQMAALAAQDYDGDWEVLVVDNGCSDGSVEAALRFADRLPSLRIVDATTRDGLNHARNAGAGAARGDYLVFCDADDVVAPGWLEAIVRAGAGADIVGGAIEVDTLNGTVRDWRCEEPLNGLPLKLDFLPAVPGGNCGMWSSVASALGFDEEFRYGGSDIEFSWRARLAGYSVAFAPEALISARHRQRLHELARQSYLYGQAAPHLYRRFRAHGVPPPDTRIALREWRWLAASSLDVVRSQSRRGRWIRTAAYRLGRLVGSLRFRVLYL